ncbi:simple sugar transport system ATP-binding protein [Spirochaetota bacterium]|nr:simple sugar transport system ATP-binding protein [Spirochaetota bacterium]
MPAAKKHTPPTNATKQNTDSVPIMSLKNVSRYFGNVIALKDMSFEVHRGRVTCLLGDNGAGKSTLIKILSGVHQPSEGEMYIENKKTVFNSPRDSLDYGIATVYQDLALVPLMSIVRNFFMGREITRGFFPFYYIDFKKCSEIAQTEMQRVGINIRSPDQAVGTLSGGERQCLAIARALYFGTRVLIFDEPTAALGVKQSAIVLDFIKQARDKNIGVIFITHNSFHAHEVGDLFTILNRGQSIGNYTRSEITRAKLFDLMAGKVTKK